MEFFAFGTILDATMIDKRLGDKPVRFEISMGMFLCQLIGCLCLLFKILLLHICSWYTLFNYILCMFVGRISFRVNIEYRNGIYLNVIMY